MAGMTWYGGRCDGGGEFGGRLRRIVILGCAGAGKSTVARRLGDRIGVPVICLDALWRPGADLPGFRAELATHHQGDGWVSDGNFAEATFDLRLPQADLIIWLEAPKTACLWRAIRRVWRRGEPHRLRDLPKLLRFIWRFDRVNRPEIEAARRVHAPHVPVVHIDHAGEADWLWLITR